MLIRSARLWDGSGAGPRPGMTLHAPHDRIVWIGPDARAPAPGPEETVVDTAGRWLLPGLIDLHVHLTFDPGEGDFRRYDVATPVPEQALLGAHHARLMLEAGFTAVRDVGAIGWANVALKRAIDAGWVPGPRMQTSGGVLTVTGGHFNSPFRPEVTVPHSGLVRGAGGAVEAVREEVKRGADWIKLLVTGGVMTGTAPLGRSLWDEAELRAAVQAAGRLGRQVAAHCHGAQGIVAAAEAGVSTVEHGTLGDEVAAAAMARHSVTLIPTFTAAAGVARAAQEGRLTPAVGRMALSLEKTHDQAFRAAVEAGVRVAMGTDTGVPGTAFGQNAGELALLVRHGLTTEQALLAATRDAAAVLGRAGELGTLVEGALADCLLLDGDPLQNADALAQLERVHLVLKGGEVVADRRP